jgi:uncharacterized repeat protein (TIGR03803 family)
VNRFPRTNSAEHLGQALPTHHSGASSARRGEQNRYRQLGLPLFAAVLLAVSVASRLQAQVPERVFNLANSSADGYSPRAGLIQGSDGNFYGTTFAGGASDKGTVFRITPPGVLTTLVEFTGNGATGKGSAPEAKLLQGSDGDFYGITSGGGSSNLGTIFRMTAAGMLTTLLEFHRQWRSQQRERHSRSLSAGRRWQLLRHHVRRRRERFRHGLQNDHCGRVDHLGAVHGQWHEQQRDGACSTVGPGQ